MSRIPGGDFIPSFPGIDRIFSLSRRTRDRGGLQTAWIITRSSGSSRRSGLRPVAVRIILGRYDSDPDHPVILAQAHDPDPLRPAADDPYLADRCPDHDPGRCHHEDLVRIPDGGGCDHDRIALELDVSHAHRPPSMPAEIIELCPLAKPDIGDGEQVVFLKERDGNDRVVAPEFHAPDTLGVPAHSPYGLLVETEALAEAGGQDEFFGAVRQDNVHELVFLLELDRVRPGRAGVGELVGRDLDGLAQYRCKQEIPVGPEFTDRDDRCHDLVF